MAFARAGLLALSVIGIIFVASPVQAEGDAARGLSIATQWCNSCHVVQQDPGGMDDGEIAPPFSTLTAQTAGTVRRLLASGHADMSALSKLTDADAADIAAYLKRLEPQPRTGR
jgi:mono/diheme cytochrome c family protein